jgi:hypothetical protein
MLSKTERRKYITAYEAGRLLGRKTAPTMNFFETNGIPVVARKPYGDGLVGLYDRKTVLTLVQARKAAKNATEADVPILQPVVKKAEIIPVALAPTDETRVTAVPSSVAEQLRQAVSELTSTVSSLLDFVTSPRFNSNISQQDRA